MPNELKTPFDNLDSAYQYVGLLCEALTSARKDVEQDIAEAQGAGAARRLEALQLVSYKLTRLESHLDSSHRILNDLRILRRLLVA